ncbi:hypothetical protein [Candidatus Nitronereus thalassa]|uniref:Uncharacterized protein n=1 Tax=Candidatus Nitronereus thalassa TaxID=3020898 RepID=A0ABU3K3K2_9BACT|nr:hypothetical protein [Candidatus Nitronereus thalassa]MDT7040961.1 hypothetical protein [Candidatus Nitronereus thalassa]
MKLLRHQFFSLSLLACLLVVGILLPSQITAHSLHHAHHQAATHASVICSWMCAAGQVVESTNLFLESPAFSMQDLEILPISSIRSTPLLLFFKRGPPILSI